MYILRDYYILKKTDLKVKHQRRAVHKHFFSDAKSLTILHSEWPKVYRALAVLSIIGLNLYGCRMIEMLYKKKSVSFLAFVIKWTKGENNKNMCTYSLLPHKLP